MRLPSIFGALLLLALAPRSDAGVMGYLRSYLLHREYSARHAPFAVTRAPREWLTGELVIVTIRNSTILWPRFSPRRVNGDMKPRFEDLERRYLEPLTYYCFLPLVEVDCAVNGHPWRPEYDWKFFGRNLE